VRFGLHVRAGKLEQTSNARCATVTRPVPLWPLPLLVALLPLLAAHLAYAISIGEGHVPACIPYFEGCTSISRAARHGLGNHLFRLLMLPSALMLTLHWLATRSWLAQRSDDAAAGRSLLLLAPFAGIALATYVAFLGTEGDVYRFLRRYGAQLYFASVYLAQVVVLKHWHRQQGGWDPIGRVWLLISALMLGLGLGYTAIANGLNDPDLKDRMENLLEWHIGLLMTAWYLLLARVWRRERLALRLGIER
jgi:hypothetical protein